MANSRKTYENAAKRWEGVGPYYAMFPTHFSDAVVSEFTQPGDSILDPFSGRGTAIFSALASDRIGIGIEINPVGWVYAKTKLNPAPPARVIARLLEINEEASTFTRAAEKLSDFFHYCFAPVTRQFLLAARAKLDWKKNQCDRTLMSLLLIYLHGKQGQAFSNQMRQTKSMAPQYSIDWWKKRNMTPPEIEPVNFMLKRINWRYAKGAMEENGSEAFWDDAVTRLPMLGKWIAERGLSKPSLLLTSPPYFAVTNYHYDQWLRLWLLGYSEDTKKKLGPHQGRFIDASSYTQLLCKTFSSASKVLDDNATVYVRTSNSEFTRETTRQALLEAFPNKSLVEYCQPFNKPTQTHLFGDKTPKAGEIDFVMQ